MNVPKIGVIIVNYNGMELTKSILDNLLKQTYSNFEIILVDNGSEDGSEEYFRNREGIHFIETGNNLGFTGGNNIGMKKALNLSCDYILLLNNDTIIESDFITELMDGFNGLDNFGAGGCKIYDAKGALWYAGGHISALLGTVFNYTTDIIKKKQQVGFITGCMMLIKREVVEKVGMLDDRYFFSFEDVQYSYRIMQAGFNLYYNPYVSLVHLVGQSSISEYYAYYSLRNRQMFIEEELSGSLTAKIYFYTAQAVKILFFWLMRHGTYRVILKAIRDYRKGIVGFSYSKS